MVDYVRASIRILEGSCIPVKGDARPARNYSKGGIIKLRNGDLLVTKLVIVKNATLPKRMITEGTELSCVHGSSCRTQHVAQISMAAAIVKEHHLDKDVHVRIVYYNSETEAGTVVTWELESAASLVQSLRASITRTLTRLRDANYFHPIQTYAISKLEQRQRRRGREKRGIRKTSKSHSAREKR